MTMFSVMTSFSPSADLDRNPDVSRMVTLVENSELSAQS